MPTVADDLALIRLKLNDPDGVLWTDAELLRAYNDGYREFCASTQAVRRVRAIDLPGRHTYGITHEWEDRHTARGSVRKASRSTYAGTLQASGQWEAEHLAGVTGTDSVDNITQEWERAHVDSTDHHFRFSFPHNHERVARLEWNHRRLSPISVRELDDTDSDWPERVGEPRWWSTGNGRVRSVEIHEIQTDYTRAYALVDAEHGTARGFSGDRTWGVAHAAPPANAYAYLTAGDAHALSLLPRTIAVVGLGVRITTACDDTSDGYTTQTWEAEMQDGETTFTTGVTVACYTWEREFGGTAMTLGVGAIRTVTSSDRQYLAAYSDAQPESLCGRIAEWQSSDSALMVTEVVLPDVDLLEEDTPALLPAPLQKYIRYFVLARAFGRPGEGRQAIFADHYLRRFKRGVQFFRSLADVARKDRVYARETFAPSAPRRPYVQLPSTFPRAL